MLIPLGFLAGSGGGVDTDYELIESYILGSSQAAVTFSSLDTYSSTYKHLQIRYVARTDRGALSDTMRMRFNSDTGSNYAFHALEGTGSGVFSFSSTGQTGISISSGLLASSAASDAFASGVIDILDFASTTKNKTTRALYGYTTSGDHRSTLGSGFRVNTEAMTSLNFTATSSANFVSGSRFSLYGIKG
jgi:hypothetical protein